MPPASGSLPSGPYPLSFVPEIVNVIPGLMSILWFGGFVWPIQRRWIVILVDTMLSIVVSATAAGLKKRASSFVPGGALGVQFPETPQSPPLGPVHVLVPALATRSQLNVVRRVM